MTLLVEPRPWLSSTFSTTNFTLGATPLYDGPPASCPAAPINPAMWVPWPYPSDAAVAGAPGSVKSRKALMRPLKSADGSRPESMRATVTPVPVQPLPFTASVPRRAAGLWGVGV